MLLFAVVLIGHAQLSEGVAAQVESVEMADGVFLIVIGAGIVCGGGVEVTVASVNVEVVEGAEDLQSVLALEGWIARESGSECGIGLRGEIEPALAAQCGEEGSQLWATVGQVGDFTGIVSELTFLGN